MSMKRALFSSNEIILTADQNKQGEFPVTNLDVMSKGIFEGNLIVTGLVVSEQSVPDMSVQVSAGFANDSTVEQFLVGEAATSLTIQPADASLVRRDVIEMRRITEDIEPESRNFKDPNTGAISTATIDTVQEYKTEYKVLTGTPGSNALPVETNWIKIAEIEVPASASSITDADIKNVDARAEGDTNTGWTNSTTATFRAGSIKDIKDKIAPKLSTISGGSTTTPGTRDLSLIADVSGADGTFTIDPPTYLGQRATLSVSGSNIATFVVNGLDIQMESGDVVDLFTIPSGSSFIWGWEKLPIKTLDINSSDTIVATVQDIQATSDTSAGDNIITVNDGIRIGQKVKIIGDGTGFTEVTYTGILSSSNNVISDGLMLSLKWDGLKWIATNVVTADYVSGSYIIQQKPDGDMVMLASLTKTDGGTSAQVFVLPIAYTFPPKIRQNHFSASIGTLTQLTAITSSSFSIVVVDFTGAATGAVRGFQVRIDGGKY